MVDSLIGGWKVERNIVKKEPQKGNTRDVAPGFAASAMRSGHLERRCFAYAVFGEKRCGYNASALGYAWTGMGLLYGAEATPQTLFAKNRTMFAGPIAKSCKLIGAWIDQIAWLGGFRFWRSPRVSNEELKIENEKFPGEGMGATQFFILNFFSFSLLRSTMKICYNSTVSRRIGP